MPLVAGAYAYYVGVGGSGGNTEYPFNGSGYGGRTTWNYGGAQDIIAGGGDGSDFDYAGDGGLVLAGTGNSGGNGGYGGNSDFYDGGGGGGGGGPSGPGGLGGGAGGSGGVGTAPGGNGGNGGSFDNGGNGIAPGGGGGGGSGYCNGGQGANGEIIITYTQQQAVPEPSTLALFGAGAIGLLVYRRKRR